MMNRGNAKSKPTASTASSQAAASEPVTPDAAVARSTPTAKASTAKAVAKTADKAGVKAGAKSARQPGIKSGMTAAAKKIKKSTPVRSDRNAGDDLTALKAELEAARQRIAELEDSQAQVLNRINWIIDSLNNVHLG